MELESWCADGALCGVAVPVLLRDVGHALFVDQRQWLASVNADAARRLLQLLYCPVHFLFTISKRSCAKHYPSALQIGADRYYGPNIGNFIDCLTQLGFQQSHLSAVLLIQFKNGTHFIARGTTQAIMDRLQQLSHEGELSLTNGQVKIVHALPSASGAPERRVASVLSFASMNPTFDSLQGLWQGLKTGQIPSLNAPADRPAQLTDALGPLNYLAAPVFAFDHDYFGISLKEAKLIDPQQRALLQLTVHAFENAGMKTSSCNADKTAVFVGVATGDYEQLLAEYGDEPDMFRLLGNNSCMAAGRVSFQLGLRGPSFSVNTSMSSSLVALQCAVEAIAADNAHLSVVAGANFFLSASNLSDFAAAGLLASEHNCKSFDVDANGFVPSEGAIACLLSAQLDPQQPPMLKIRSAVVNHDGNSASLMLPSCESQALLHRMALQHAKLQASEVAAFEAHGSGTSAGDHVELTALNAVYGSNSALDITTAKSVLGHLWAAGGLFGLAKVALECQFGSLSCHAHTKLAKFRLSPDLATAPFQIPFVGTNNVKQLIGCSSFSYNGTNAHVIAESVDSNEPLALGHADLSLFDICPLFALSAKTRSALQALQTEFLAAFERSDKGTTAICASASQKPQLKPFRLAVAGKDAAGQLVKASTKDVQLAGDSIKRSALIVANARTGGRSRNQTLKLFSGFQAFFSHARNFFLENAEWVALEDCETFAGSLANSFCFNYMMSRIWHRCGLAPAYYVGYASGQIIAAVLASALNLRDAVRIFTAEVKLIEASFVIFRTLEVHLKAAVSNSDFYAAFRQRCSGFDTVLAQNGPTRCVVSSAVSAVTDISQMMTFMGHSVRSADASLLSHSTAAHVYQSELQSLCDTIAPGQAQVPVVLGSTGKPATVIDASFWATNLLHHVDFLSGVAEISADVAVFVEAGSTDSLTRHARAICQQFAAAAVSVPSFKGGRVAILSMADAFCELYNLGLDVSWQSLVTEPTAKLTVNYPFSAVTCWQYEQTKLADNAETLEAVASNQAAQVCKPTLRAKAAGRSKKRWTGATDPVSIRHTIFEELQAVAGSERKLEDSLGFHQMGLDSIMVSEFTTRLRHRFSAFIQVSSTVTFEYSNIQELVEYISREMTQFVASSVDIGEADFDQPHTAVLETNPRQHRLALADRALKLQTKHPDQDCPVFLSGIASYLPMAEQYLHDYMQLLKCSKSASTRVQRWSSEQYYDADPNAPGKVYFDKLATIADATLKCFDTELFHVSNREAKLVDPQHRLLLQLTWNAFESAGVSVHSQRNEDIGVYVGITSHDFDDILQTCYKDNVNPYQLLGNSYSIAAGRLSFTYGFEGPALSVDTACSSSMVSLILARSYLETTQFANYAIAAGAQLFLGVKQFINGCRLKAFAPDGQCKTFDASADGIGCGDGNIVVLLSKDASCKKYCQISGCSVNQDGKSGGLTVPNGLAQEKLLFDAAALAKLTVGQLDYLEAHGTGTTLGDPIEMNAVASVRRQFQCSSVLPIGSVKANIGHTFATAGLASLAKIILMQNFQTTFAHPHFSVLNPKIRGADDFLNISVLPEGTFHKNVGVSSFGMSGTNAHIVSAAVPQFGSLSLSSASFVSEMPFNITTIEGNTVDALARQDKEVSNFKQEASSNMNLLFLSKNSLPVRKVAIHMKDVLSQRSSTSAFTSKADSGGASDSLLFFFTGAGGDLFNMAKQLYHTSTAFRKGIDDTCEHLGMIGDDGKNLLDILYPPSNEPLPTKTYSICAQNLVFAVEYALTRLLAELGLTPSVVMGHSLGELVAATVAGVLSHRDMCTLSAVRGKLFGARVGAGASMAVQGDSTMARAVLKSFCSSAQFQQCHTLGIATENSPTQIAFSGDLASVESFRQLCSFVGLKTILLPMKTAVHSKLLSYFADELVGVAQTLTHNLPNCALLQNVTGQVATIVEPHYWIEHTTQTVKFENCVKTALEYDCYHWVEVSHQPVLTNFVLEILASSDSADRNIIPTLRRGSDDWRCVLSAVSKLYTAGVNVQWHKAFGNDNNSTTCAVNWMPLYQFSGQQCWPKVDLSAQLDGVPLKSEQQFGHPLLQQRIPVCLSGNDTLLYETNMVIGTRQFQYVQDHVVFGQIAVPGAFMLESLLSAANTEFGTDSELVDFRIDVPLVAGKSQTNRIQIALHKSQRGHQLSFYSRENHSFVKHCKANVSIEIVEESERDEALQMSDYVEVTEIANCYNALAHLGVEYGPAFQTVKQLFYADGISVGSVKQTISSNTNSYIIHPTMLDGIFQTCLLKSGKCFAPYMIHKFSMKQLQTHQEVLSKAVYSIDESQIIVDITVFLDSGIVVGKIQKFIMRNATFADFNKFSTIGEPSRMAHEFYTVQWEASALQLGTELSPSKLDWYASNVCEYRTFRALKMGVPSLTYGSPSSSTFYGVLALFKCHPDNHASSTENIKHLQQTIKSNVQNRLAALAVVVLLSEETKFSTKSMFGSIFNGFLKSVSQEKPQLQIRLIICSDSTINTVANEIRMLEIAAVKQSVVCHTSNERFVQRLVRHDEVKFASDNLLTSRKWQVSGWNTPTPRLKDITTNTRCAVEVLINTACCAHSSMPMLGYSAVVDHCTIHDSSFIKGDTVIGNCSINILSSCLTFDDENLISKQLPCFSYSEGAIAGALAQLSNSDCHRALRESILLAAELHMEIKSIKLCDLTPDRSQHTPHEFPLLLKLQQDRIHSHSCDFDSENRACDCTSLITGGIYGVNSTIIDWLHAKGLRTVSLSRKSVSECTTRLSSHTVVQADVGNKKQMSKAFQLLGAARNLTCIVHSSVVLNDALIENSTWPSFEHVFKPKMLGVWNLHSLTQSMWSISHFIAFSSVMNAVGNAGQTAYTAANAFLEELIVHRRSKGLPGVAIEWGQWQEVGGATDSSITARTAHTGIMPMSTDYALSTMEQALTANSVIVTLAVLHFNKVVATYPNTADFLQHLVEPEKDQKSAKEGPLRESVDFPKLVSEKTGLKQKKNIAQTVRKCVCKVFEVENVDTLDEKSGFTQMGMDSLMSVELQNLLEDEFSEVKLSSTLVFEHANIASLIKYITAIHEKQYGTQDEAALADRKIATDGKVKSRPSAQVKNNVAETVRKCVCKVFEIEDAGSLDETGGFTQMGMDSLMSVELQSLLESEFSDVRLSSTIIFEHPSIAMLIKHIASIYEKEHAATGQDIVHDTQFITMAAVQSDIHIFSSAGLFPSSRDLAENFYELLQTGTNGISKLTEPRCQYSSPSFRKHPKFSAGFLDHSVALFDAAYFGISPKESVLIDPQQRLLLETAVQVIENANTRLETIRGSDTSVYLGISTNDYDSIISGAASSNQLHMVTGVASAFASGRIAYALGLHGPNLVVDTACSSSIVAMSCACSHLRGSAQGSWSIVGAANLILSSTLFNRVVQSGILAPDAQCKTFDASADGFTRAETVSVVLLGNGTHSHDALARVKACVLNHGGTGSGLTVPNGAAQEQLLLMGRREASLDAGQLRLLECHGTGTSLGDPIECNAIIAAHENVKKELALSAVKSNVGHCEAGAGMAGLFRLLKVCDGNYLGLQNHFKVLNAKILLQDTQISLPIVGREVENGTRQPQCMGLSSFGMSGTNAHAIFASVKLECEDVNFSSNQMRRSATLFPCSLKSHHDSEFLSTKQYLLSDLARPLTDVARAASLNRDHYKTRSAFLIGLNSSNCISQSRINDCEIRANQAHWRRFQGAVAYLYSPEQTTHSAVGKQLNADTSSVFASTFRTCWKEFRNFLPNLQQGYPLETKSESAGLAKLFAMQVSLAHLWQSWGIDCSHIVGHSRGEYAAAVGAGVVTLQDGVFLTAAKGLLLDNLDEGCTAALSANRCIVEKLLKRNSHESQDENVWITSFNCPAQLIVGGERTAVRGVKLLAETIGHQSSTVNPKFAFHTPLMKTIAQQLYEKILNIDYKITSTGLYANLTGKLATMLNADYWMNQLTSQVHFQACVENMLTDGIKCFLEIGPHPILLPFVKQCAKHYSKSDNELSMIASLNRKVADWHAILTGLGKAYVQGANVSWESVYEQQNPRRLKLANYPFLRYHYWAKGGGDLESDIGEADNVQFANHPLLRKMITITDTEVRYQSNVSMNSPFEYLADHKVNNQAVFPGTGYLEMFIAAAAMRSESEIVTIENIYFHAMLELTHDDVILQTSVNGCELAISSLRSTGLRKHASAKLGIEAKPTPPTFVEIDLSLVQSIEPSKMYEYFASIGLEYTNTFQCCNELVMGDSKVQAILCQKLDGPGYYVHPAFLDSCLHSCFFGCFCASESESPAGPVVPIKISSFTLYNAACPSSVIATASRTGSTLACTVWSQTGRSCHIHVEGIETKVLQLGTNSVVKAKSQAESTLVYQIVFEELADKTILLKRGEENVLCFLPESVRQEWISSCLLDSLNVNPIFLYAKRRSMQLANNAYAVNFADATNGLESFLQMVTTKLNVENMIVINHLTDCRYQSESFLFNKNISLFHYVTFWKTIIKLNLNASIAVFERCGFQEQCSSNVVFNSSLAVGFIKAAQLEYVKLKVKIVDTGGNLTLCQLNNEIGHSEVVVLSHQVEMQRCLTGTNMYTPVLTKAAQAMTDNLSYDKEIDVDGVCVKLSVRASRSLLVDDQQFTIMSGPLTNATDCFDCGTTCLAICSSTQGTAGLFPVSNCASFCSLISTVAKLVTRISTNAAGLERGGGLLSLIQLLLCEMLEPEDDSPTIAIESNNLPAGQASHLNDVTHLPPSVEKISGNHTNSSCLITGALGGIGIETVKYLSPKFKYLHLLSRKPAQADVTSRISAMVHKDAVIHIHAANVGNASRLTLTLSCLPHKLDAIFHLAAVLDGAVIDKLSWKQYLNVAIPKVLGTWNLHRSTGLHTKAFVMFSSLAAEMGGRGEANYAAANAFTDALVRWRRARGLVAQTLNWGGWEEVGMATTLDTSATSFAKTIMMSNEEGIRALDQALRLGDAQLILTKFRDPELLAKYMPSLTNWLKHVIADEHSKKEQQAKPKQTGDEGTVVNQSEIQGILEACLRVELALPQTQNVDEMQTFISMGMDSLMMVDFVSRVNSKLRSLRELTTQEVLEHDSVKKLTVFFRQAVSSRQDNADDQAKRAICLHDIKIPTSFQQKRNWYFSLINSDAYNSLNLNAIIRLPAVIDLNKVGVCTNKLFQSQTVTRSVFTEQHEQIAWSATEAYSCTTCLALRQKAQVFTALANFTFSLTSGTLRKQCLASYRNARSGIDETAVLIVLNHTISDAYSIGVLVSQLATHYMDTMDTTFDIQNSYAMFAIEQRELASTEAAADHLIYWRDNIQDYNCINIPTDMEWKPVQSIIGAFIAFDVEASIGLKLHQWSQLNGVTPYDSLLTAFLKFLATVSDQDDILIGSATDNRSPKLTHLIGYISTNFFVRQRQIRNMSLEALSKAVHLTVVEANKHAYLPYELLLNKLSMHKHWHYSPLIQVLFILVPMSAMLSSQPRLFSDISTASNSVAEHNYTWHMAPTGSAYTAKAKFQTAVHWRSSIVNHVKMFMSIVLEMSPQRQACSLKFPALTENALLKQMHSRKGMRQMQGPALRANMNLELAGVGTSRLMRNDHSFTTASLTKAVAYLKKLWLETRGLSTTKATAFAVDGKADVQCVLAAMLCGFATVGGNLTLQTTLLPPLAPRHARTQLVLQSSSEACLQVPISGRKRFFSSEQILAMVSSLTRAFCGSSLAAITIPSCDSVHQASVACSVATILVGIARGQDATVTLDSDPALQNVVLCKPVKSLSQHHWFAKWSEAKIDEHKNEVPGSVFICNGENVFKLNILEISDSIHPVMQKLTAADNPRCVGWPILESERARIASSRPYSADDLVKFMPDGLWLAGKPDSFTKVNGMRINVNSIKTVVYQLDFVAKALVFLANNMDGHVSLVLVFTTKSVVTAPGRKIRFWLHQTFPHCYVPKEILWLDSIPSHLPTDIETLKSLLYQYPAHQENQSDTESESAADHGDVLLQQVAAIWRNVIGNSALGLDEQAFNKDSELYQCYESAYEIAKTTRDQFKLHKLPISAALQFPTIRLYSEYLRFFEEHTPEEMHA